MIGEKIRLLREQKKMTQEQLAKLVNLSQQTIDHYEKGRAKPSIDTVSLFASIFSVSTDYLLGRTDDPSPRPKIETIAAHRTDDPMDELPEAARKSVEEFIDYIYKKYGKKN